MIAPDDLHAGQFVTILRGHTTTCEYGCCHSEKHAGMKGICLAVMATNLPYVLVRLVPCGTPKLLDVRECEFIHASHEWVAAFAAMGATHAKDQPACEAKP